MRGDSSAPRICVGTGTPQIKARFERLFKMEQQPLPLAATAGTAAGGHSSRRSSLKEEKEVMPVNRCHDRHARPVTAGP